jgi:hypothetical protein
MELKSFSLFLLQIYIFSAQTTFMNFFASFSSFLNAHFCFLSNIAFIIIVIVIISLVALSFELENVQLIFAFNLKCATKEVIYLGRGVLRWKFIIFGAKFKFSFSKKEINKKTVNFRKKFLVI